MPLHHKVNPAGNQTYFSVCPSLLNGTYLLPVTANRGLVLNTKNLPPQVLCIFNDPDNYTNLQTSGYTYACRITLQNGTISLRTSYINNTSIRCMYTAAQISLPVGTTAMVAAEINLIWTNGSTVMYPIDPRGVIQGEEMGVLF